MDLFNQITVKELLCVFDTLNPEVVMRPGWRPTLHEGAIVLVARWVSEVSGAQRTLHELVNANQELLNSLAFAKLEGEGSREVVPLNLAILFGSVENWAGVGE